MDTLTQLQALVASWLSPVAGTAGNVMGHLDMPALLALAGALG